MTLDIGTRLDGSPFALPIDAASARIVLLGKSGAGKSTAAAVLIEEAYKAGVAPIVLDPLGNLYGLRSSADGQSAGIPVAIFGGQHGDVPLPLDRAHYVADLVAEGVPSVFDLSEMPTEEQVEFANVFLPRLLQQAAIHRRNLFVVLEEADRFAKNTGRTTPVTMFSRAARNAGIGWLFSTHKPAVVHKEILDTANLFVAMKMTGELAQDAIGGEIGSRIGKKTAVRMVNELPSFGRGDAWFVPDGDWLADDREWEPERIRFRNRWTFHVQPPRVGQERTEPKVLAAVDMAAIRDALAIEPASDPEDVDALKARIAELEAELKVPIKSVVERVEVPVFTEEQVREQVELLDGLNRALAHVEAEWKRSVEKFAATAGPALVRLSHDFAAALARIPTPTLEPSQPRAPRRPEIETAGTTGFDLPIRAGGRRMLEACARFPRVGLTRTQLGTLAGVKQTSGTFSTYLSELKREAYVVEQHGRIYPTSKGNALLGAARPDVLTTPDAVLAFWRGHFREGARRMLDVIVDAHPTPVSRKELSAKVGIATTSGTFSTYLSELRRADLVAEDSAGLCASVYDRQYAP